MDNESKVTQGGRGSVILDKPKELIGKVKKFEDWLSVWLRVLEGYPLHWREIHEFYTEPFKSEMIEKYFILSDEDGWDYANYIELGVAHFNESEIWFTNENNGVNEIRFAPKPKTLSDFIDACLNSNIELEWKATDSLA